MLANTCHLAVKNGNDLPRRLTLADHGPYLVASKKIEYPRKKEKNPIIETKKGKKKRNGNRNRKTTDIESRG